MFGIHPFVRPVSFVMTASDLDLLSPVNVMTKFKNDMYLIVPVSNVKSCRLKVDHIEECAKDNNLVLNRSKYSNEVSILYRLTTTSCSKIQRSRMSQIPRNGNQPSTITQ